MSKSPAASSPSSDQGGSPAAGNQALQNFSTALKRSSVVPKAKEAAANAVDKKKNAADDLAAQVELSRAEDKIWSALLKGDLAAVRNIVDKDHNACLERGGVGEVPLHLAFLYNSDKHFEIAQFLIDRAPECLGLVYENPLYQGENVLHIAIVNKRIEWIKYLVDKAQHLGVDLFQAQATGTFFAGPHVAPTTCYFGEFPLGFAACTSQPTLVEYLVGKGADLDAVDSHGNNILHLCVQHGLPDMYTFVLDLWTSRNPNFAKVRPLERPLDKRRNHDMLTPFCLAADMNNTKMFEFILESRKMVQWTYGHVSSNLYPMDELDPLWDPNDRHFKGALQIIVDKANLETLSIPRVDELLQTKWDRCAANAFYRKFMHTIIYLMIFMTATILRTDKTCIHVVDQAETDGEPAMSHDECFEANWLTVRVKQCCELLVLLGAMWKGMIELREVVRKGFMRYMSARGSAFVENTTSSAYCLCIALSVVFHVLGSDNEDVCIAVGSLFAWAYMLFFLLGFKMTGPFIVMMWEMLVVDVTRFAVLVFVFFFGFTQSLYIIFDDDGVVAFSHRLKSMFLAMLGDFDFEDYSGTRFPAVAVTLLVVFVVVVTIMLLNILVAMMGDTYGKVSEQAQQQWCLERARIMFSIQNEMTPEERLLKQHCYWVNVDANRFLQIVTADEAHYKSETSQEMPALREQLDLPVRPGVAEIFKKMDDIKKKSAKEEADAEDEAEKDD